MYTEEALCEDLIFAANFAAHFGVQKVAYPPKMAPTRAQSASLPIPMISATIP